ncbi:acylneuraminate cytidylyltransferase family protein [Paenibacillus sp. IB182496]|uniref:Acylneuraminate cytidylyltransferase family protein n=1 Tax=Paenibacillus sabuli TaxID=2772509 RepID=A0A927GR37_9BACL|nr:acylneuraminate cytidylyltransferase family protein [Paenibacillus sabuli]MBD2844515.1 acylneuraminate cytidylyltransferase family protein [Paenibacillus sabuli]
MKNGRLCTICARGGSTGVPGKNLRPLGGVPLLLHTLTQAQDSGLFAAIAVSSDSAAILETASRYGADCTIARPAALATATAPKLPAIRHCASETARVLGGSWDTVVDLDVTAPLRLPEDIAGAVRLLEEDERAGNVITAAPSRRSPYFNMVELGPDGAPRLVKTPSVAVARRQDTPPTYDMNASIYVWRWSRLMAGGRLLDAATRLYVMPPERSLDIDTELDWELVAAILERGRRDNA